tara:strand:+ start:3342 stop:6287 length:2946 start_codon:yes stop_codon:yes gene_type:complete
MRVLGLLLGLVVLAVGIMIAGWGAPEEVDPDERVVLIGNSEGSTHPLTTPVDGVLSDEDAAEAPNAKDRNLAGARIAVRGRVDGRLVLDPMTPKDEVVRLYVDYLRSEGQIIHRLNDEMLSVAVDPHGRFTIGLPSELTYFRFTVEGRYHLDVFEFAASDPRQEIVLEPDLLGSVHARIELQGQDPGVTTVWTREQGRHWLGMEGFHVEAQPMPNGTFELPALASERPYAVHAIFENLVDTTVRGIRVRPGEITEIVISPTVGCRLAGFVTDSKGNAVGGAKVDSTSRLGRGDLAVDLGSVMTESASDGSFELRGVPPGMVKIRIDSTNHEYLLHDLGEIHEDELRNDLVLTLRDLPGLPTGIISGSVRMPDGAPVDNADVWIEHDEANSECQSTDHLGAFAFTELPPGTVRIAAAWSDLESGYLHAKLNAIPVDSKDVELILEPSEALSGMIVDDLGTPIQWEYVDAYSYPGPDETVLMDCEALHGDLPGSFVFPGLFAGPWSIEAWSENHMDSAVESVLMPHATGSVTIVCRRLGSVSGKVVDSAGFPIPDAWVRGPGWATSTESDGSFMMNGADIGLGTVTAGLEGFADSEPVHVEVRSGAETKDVELVLRKGATLEGSFHASIEDPDTRDVVVAAYGSHESVNLLVAADGTFRDTGLTPGRYIVSRAWMGGDDWVLAFANRMEVEVILTEGQTTHVVLGADRPGVVHVTGTVRESGNLASGYTVYVFEEERGVRVMPVSISRTNSEGVFELDVPAAGTYRFSIGEQQSMQTIFTRAVESNHQVSLEFEMPHGTVRGTVLDPDGRPLAGHALALTMQEAPNDTREFGELRTMVTSEDGSFETTGLAAGRYRLRASGLVATNEDELNNHAHSVQRDIVVLDGEVTEIVAQLRVGALVEGVVLGADGAPIRGVRIDVRDAHGEPAVLWHEIVTDANGRFRVNRVPSGPVTVEASTNDGRLASQAVVARTGESSTVQLRLR